MSEHDGHHHLEVTDGDRTVARAEVTTSPDAAAPARASLHAEAGHIPPGSRASLVDAVLDLPQVQDSDRVQVALPLGDSESLHQLQQRCDHVTSRAAGSTAIVEGALPESRHD